MSESQYPGLEKDEVENKELIRAAEYVRMSTEHQKYSTENQSEMIRDYADKHSMTVVRTYADDGKSGLSIAGRHSLKQLIDDVQNDMADFKVILVYDISRWGRFQDADESAYYEYICKQAGITVQYCAEQFENDGSPVSTIVKSVKRAMAGEYSRELSTKVFKGQCKLIELGFRQGGTCGFGIKRMLIDQHGNHKGILKQGEHKSLQTDRVILIPGDRKEVQTVREMYDMFVKKGKPETEIAETLNKMGIKTDFNRPWTRSTIRQVLTNEKYIGNNVFNRMSFKLKQKRVKNSPDMWIRADGVFEPIVDHKLFYQAQGIIMERCRRFSDQELLDKLKQLYTKHGMLSGLLIDDTESMPSSSVYRTRFNSLVKAYQLVGFTPERNYEFLETNRFMRKMHYKTVTDVLSTIKNMGAQILKDEKTDILTINDEFTASIVIARCRYTPAGSLRWLIRFDTSLDPDITVALRMDQTNTNVLDYYLLPLMDMTTEKLRMAEDNGIILDTYRFENLDFFLGMAEQVKLKVAI
jgi:DNA invertase Pin-like site-specific DNA recombinase